MLDTGDRELLRQLASASLRKVACHQRISTQAWENDTRGRPYCRR